MSAANSASRNAPAHRVNTNLNSDKTDDVRLPVVEKIDLASLQIDESYEADCDPYNSTGQFLVSAIKAKYED